MDFADKFFHLSTIFNTGILLFNKEFNINTLQLDFYIVIDWKF